MGTAPDPGVRDQCTGVGCPGLDLTGISSCGSRSNGTARAASPGKVLRGRCPHDLGAAPNPWAPGTGCNTKKHRELRPARRRVCPSQPQRRLPQGSSLSPGLQRANWNPRLRLPLHTPGQRPLPALHVGQAQPNQVTSGNAEGRELTERTAGRPHQGSDPWGPGLRGGRPVAGQAQGCDQSRDRGACSRPEPGGQRQAMPLPRAGGAGEFGSHVPGEQAQSSRSPGRVLGRVNAPTPALL